LRDKPFAGASNSALGDQVVLSHWAIGAPPAFVADRYPPIRLGCVVLVELRPNMQTLG